MILTGKKILKEILKSKITINPFDKNNLNPNSYNYRLGRFLKKIENNKIENIDLKKYPDGYIIEKTKLYIGSTFEVIGSKKYAMSLIGRSSMGRLGLFLQISANLGHVYSEHNWTLEIVSCLNIKIYYKMKIGQVSFWKNFGFIEKREGKYNKFNEPTISLGIEKNDTNWKQNKKRN